MKAERNRPNATNVAKLTKWIYEHKSTVRSTSVKDIMVRVKADLGIDVSEYLVRTVAETYGLVPKRQSDVVEGRYTAKQILAMALNELSIKLGGGCFSASVQNGLNAIISRQSLPGDGTTKRKTEDEEIPFG